jgi:hypothetical protein
VHRAGRASAYSVTGTAGLLRSIAERETPPVDQNVRPSGENSPSWPRPPIGRLASSRGRAVAGQIVDVEDRAEGDRRAVVATSSPRPWCTGATRAATPSRRRQLTVCAASRGSTRRGPRHPGRRARPRPRRSVRWRPEDPAGVVGAGPVPGDVVAGPVPWCPRTRRCTSSRVGAAAGAVGRGTCPCSAVSGREPGPAGRARDRGAPGHVRPRQPAPDPPPAAARPPRGRPTARRRGPSRTARGGGHASGPPVGALRRQTRAARRRARRPAGGRRWPAARPRRVRPQPAQHRERPRAASA